METIIVYVDDAAYAQQQLAPMLGGPAAPGTHWVLVACAPRMTHRISKWVSHSARENWREKWADKLYALLVPPLQAAGHAVTTVIAKGPLTDLTAKLQAEHAATRVLDARRPKFGQDLPPVTPDQPAAPQSPWAVPGAVAGLGAMLVLAAE
ncbi:hypothetical protein PY257_08320 [Ramlibacter sp. H39-3-26]|uniref:hypothetical protein n=1 Tax=Curvibacter soli TaxID=3031331 RepID=UPI0023DC871B|nr:hypothetical protein [Ramlibacter sp. H39-3-26]MDF1485184.1 hypothetical protein [Ramlibacter sp. H39-3-26]